MTSPAKPTIESIMDTLAADGWCVVLKRLPKEMAWTIEGSRSEYDAPCADKKVGKGMWLAEAQDVSYMRKSAKFAYRNSRDALGETPLIALAKLHEYLTKL